VCELGTLIGEDELFETLDRVELTLGAQGPADTGEAVLVGTVALQTARRVAVSCEPSGDAYNLYFRDRSIVAQQVGELAAF
jgi:hypothetical protein